MKARKGLLTAAAAAAALALALTGCADSDNDDADDSQNPPSTSSTDSGSGDSSDTSDTAEGADLATTEFALSWEDALDQAKQNFDGDLYSIGLDWERTEYAYTVKLLSDTEEYEVELGADSGDVLAEETENMESDDAAEKRAEIIDVDEVVPWKDALATAQDATEGNVNEWKLEGTQQGPHYQFDIGPAAGQDVEVTVDAYTGDIVKQGD